MPLAPPPNAHHRSSHWLVLLALLCALGFGALSAWQWQRLGWKQALIARIERQLAGAPQAAPGPAAWPTLSREADEYRRIQLRARPDPAREALVLASTELGRGHWLLVPAQTADGHWVWLNQGFVDDAHRSPASRPMPAGEQTLTGLLRWTEPKGWLWQRNDPAAGRWVSRDVAALSAAAGLPADRVAPYFVDLAANADAPEAFPRGGLTVLHFANNHLVYALTWLALAGGCAAAALWLWRGQGSAANDNDDEQPHAG